VRNSSQKSKRGSLGCTSRGKSIVKYSDGADDKLMACEGEIQHKVVLSFSPKDMLKASFLGDMRKFAVRSLCVMILMPVQRRIIDCLLGVWRV
jgi:hypothetical protein